MHALIAEAASASDQLSMAQMCRVLSLPRATYYRGDTPVSPLDGDLTVRAHIQSIALEMPASGYRRLTHELQRRGLEANHKRVLRLMHEDNLLCLRKKAFVRTTDSPHRFMRDPNRLPALAVSGVNPRWVADITSIACSGSSSISP
jgi:putative transposase